MSEPQNNPLNDFLNQTEAEPTNNLFADISFPQAVETVSQQIPQESAASVQTAQTTPPPAMPVQPAIVQEPQPIAAVPTEAENSRNEIPEAQPAPHTSLFAEALAQTPASSNPLSFEDAIRKAKSDSESLLVDSFAEKDAIFNYGKAKDPITDRDCTFEDLRAKYETDFPELSEAKNVSWKMLYGKVTKIISNPGAVKVYDMKAEIEKSKQFIENIKKAKKDADKNPECLVKPFVTAQSKGEAQFSAYKEYCSSVEDAQASSKPIVIIPSRDGKIYEMRKTPVGTFMAPAEFLPEFPLVGTGFQMALPKIPMHILMFILNFFGELSKRHKSEALVHILYDTMRGKYTMRVPKQELTHTSVHSVMEEEYPEHLIHVMDIHSHNIMPAIFSDIDDKDEKATRLYAVVGKIDQVFPEITVRASCAGKFIPLQPEDIFENKFKAYPYPSMWDEQITLLDKSILPTLALHKRGNFRCFRIGEEKNNEVL